MLLKGDSLSEGGALPDPKMLAAMGAYNEMLMARGALLGGEGLHPSAKGARVSLSGGKPSIVDGPFAEAKELIAGYWLIRVESLDEAIELTKRLPYAPEFVPEGGEVELRPLQGDEPRAQGTASGTRKFMLLFSAEASGAALDAMNTAGVLLSSEVLQPAGEGALVCIDPKGAISVHRRYDQARPLGSICTIQVDSTEQALEWAARALQGVAGECEVRAVQLESDFGEELRAEVPEVFEAERKMREKLGT